MRKFHSSLWAAIILVGLGSCSPKLIALTEDNSSAALPAGTSYALVHFYRPSKLVGFLIGYDVHVGDSVKYRAKDGSRGDVRRMVPGPVTVWAKTEAREEITLAVLPGREYYVRCTLGVGAVVGRPHFQQVTVAQGQKETAGLTMLVR